MWGTVRGLAKATAIVAAVTLGGCRGTGSIGADEPFNDEAATHALITVRNAINNSTVTVMLYPQNGPPKQLVSVGTNQSRSFRYEATEGLFRLGVQSVGARRDALTTDSFKMQNGQTVTWDLTLNQLIVRAM